MLVLLRIFMRAYVGGAFEGQRREGENKMGVLAAGGA